MLKTFWKQIITKVVKAWIKHCLNLFCLGILLIRKVNWEWNRHTHSRTRENKKKHTHIQSRMKWWWIEINNANCRMFDMTPAKSTPIRCKVQLVTNKIAQIIHSIYFHERIFQIELVQNFSSNKNKNEILFSSQINDCQSYNQMPRYLFMQMITYEKTVSNY